MAQHPGIDEDDLDAFDAGPIDDRTVVDPPRATSTARGPGDTVELPWEGDSERGELSVTEALRWQDWREDRQAARQRVAQEAIERNRRDRRESETRDRLAIAIIVTLCISVVGVIVLTIVIVLWQPTAEATIKDFALPVITGFGPIAGAVVAFYYTERRGTPPPSAPEPPPTFQPPGTI